MGRPADSPTAQTEYIPAGPDKVAECKEGGSCVTIDRQKFLESISDSDRKAYENWEKTDRKPGEHFKLPSLSLIDDSQGKSSKNSSDTNSTPETSSPSDKTSESNKDGQDKGEKVEQENLFDGARSGAEENPKETSATGEAKIDGQAKADDKPKSEWDKTIEASGAATFSQASDVYKQAFNEQKGVAIAIVGENTPGSKELLAKLPELQKANPNLNFMVVDKDAIAQRLAANPDDKSAQNWDKWIKDNQKDCNGQPIDMAKTSVQSLKADESGRIGPDKVTSTHWGADIEAGLKDQGRYAASSTARNFAAAQTDFSPKPEVKPEDRTDSRPNTDLPAEKGNQSANKQGQNQNTSGKEQETPNKESKVQEKENETAKKETPFLKDEKDQVDNKAKDEQAAKEAKDTTDKQNAKDDQSKSPEALEKEATAKTAEQERQLERERKIKAATSKEYSNDEYQKVKELAKELGLPVIVEVGSVHQNWCGHCVNFRNAQNRNEVNPLKTADGKALVVQVDIDTHRNLANQVPGYNGGGVPYFNVLTPNKQTGQLEAVGAGERGFNGRTERYQNGSIRQFSASEWWSESRARELKAAQERMTRQR